MTDVAAEDEGLIAGVGSCFSSSSIEARVVAAIVQDVESGEMHSSKPERPTI